MNRITGDDAIIWRQGHLYLLDQRKLPGEVVFLELNTAAETARAITDMVVRGAPAIGITAAYGVVLAGAMAFRSSADQWQAAIQADLEQLRRSRPTAVNLFWALKRMGALLEGLPRGADPTDALLREAIAIHKEDIRANRDMGELGASLIEAGSGVITHCNAGALATGGYGTALGVIRSAHKRGLIREVFADETRPWLQGARLTAWELLQDGIPVTLLADGAAAHRMAQGGIDWIVVGSDRIAANGDVANKIGTYSLAVAAKHHGVKVMVAAPTSTIDMELASGSEIPIEVRGEEELLGCGGRRVAANGAGVWNPVFDVTPADLVDAIVTERGVATSPNRKKIEKMMANRPESP
ncbi:MAG: S-methyl-5-thioribose-1-phosphate isomerase [gamma proteobacterium symbiont of Ctena orbiculata]|nr:MAG: S-methyl-5-thioribose-1-phosphate isomerase [gamma proteobacterium symbiont of Ctena orbiculata]PVV15964.1 MAG: S-methyl-5-thioribose-1-phosphate isomerase [gamma proteobacterium symbiont of Ctena orbiculata]PVV20670.1 MAG: S-methyl-5-thioribose-1-phosphate isomerase [gamma proteobacterium symbiont of Ctena orbiculata]